MRRRIHIEFLSKNLVRFTTFSKQKTIDISKIPTEYLDLITLKYFTEERFYETNHGFVFNIEERTLYFTNESDDEWLVVGTATVGKFVWYAGVPNYYTNPLKEENTNEGTFEVNLKE